MRLYMIRHGESVDDIEDCYGGIADFPLTEKGRKQAENVGEKLLPKGIQAIYSSPLSRAKESSKIIAEMLKSDIPIIEVADLQERNSYGVLSGVNKNRAKEIFGRVLAELTEVPGYSREPLVGAEEFDSFIFRVHKAFDYVLKDAQTNNRNIIAIVTHGKFTQGLFEYVLKLSEKIDLKLSAINVIDYEPAKVKLITD